MVVLYGSRYIEMLWNKSKEACAHEGTARMHTLRSMTEEAMLAAAAE